MIYKVTLNSKTYEVEVEKGEAMVKSEYEAVSPVAAVSAPAPQAQAAPVAVQAAPAVAPQGSASEGAIKSPLPGTINAVKVTQGQKVAKGAVLLVLEAMKMENDIVSPKDGTVGQIYVQKGASVSTGAPLVEIL